MSNINISKQSTIASAKFYAPKELKQQASACVDHQPFKSVKFAICLGTLSVYTGLTVYRGTASADDNSTAHIDTTNIDTTLEEIVVSGRAIDHIGQAKSGSEGTVGYSDFENRPS